MPDAPANPQEQKLIAEIEQLRASLEVHEQTLDAIRSGKVDALVVNGEGTERVMTLHIPEPPYRLMIENMHEGVVVLAPSGEIRYANHSFARMIGEGPQELVGIPMQDLLSMASRDQWVPRLRYEDSTDYSGDASLDTKDGRPVPVQLNITTLPGASSAYRCCIVIDLTGALKRAAQLRNLSAQLTDVEQRERRRLATILHDQLQQSLVAALMHLQAARRTAPAALQASITFAEAALADSMKTSRNLTTELSPQVLHEAGLDLALRWLAAHFEKNYGLTVSVDAAPTAAPLSEPLRAALFLGTRELLFNTVKHSGTHQAHIRMRDEDGELQIVVSDGGKGFDPAQLESSAAISDHFGLFHIRERIEGFGGQLIVHSKPRKGTTVTIKMPTSAWNVESAGATTNNT